MKSKLIIFVFLFLFPSISSFEGEVNYSDQTTWGGICVTGDSQSPIDIPAKKDCTKDNSYAKIVKVNYSKISGENVEFANEYTYRIKTKNNGGITVKINDVEYIYELNNIHFHLNSEHTFNGKSYEMEMHLVHELSDESESKDPNDKNEYLVIAIVYTVSGTKDDDFIDKVNFDTQDDVNNLDLKQFVSDSKSFYYYHGSLTTPHCDESVNWIVMDNIYTMSTSQFEDFQNFIQQEYPDGNNREVKPLNGRKVYYVKGSSSKCVDLSFLSVLLLFIIL